MMKRRSVPAGTLALFLVAGSLALGALAGCSQNTPSEDPKPGNGTTGSIGSHAVGAKEGPAGAPGGAAPMQKAPDQGKAKPLAPD